MEIDILNIAIIHIDMSSREYNTPEVPYVSHIDLYCATGLCYYSWNTTSVSYKANNFVDYVRFSDKDCESSYSFLVNEIYGLSLKGQQIGWI